MNRVSDLPPAPEGSPNVADRGEAAAPPRDTPPPARCLNCDAEVAGHFCAHCGQENKDQTIALRLLLADLAAEVASFDSKLFRTLVPLVVRPGLLTREYNAGRRARYLPPFKMYLTMSVLFFLVLSWKNPLPISRPDAPSAPLPLHGSIHLGQTTLDVDRLPHTVGAYEAQQKVAGRGQQSPPAVQFVARQLIKFRQSPQGYLERFLDSIPKMMFFLLPVFALMLKLLYPRRLYIEHLIFSLHCHAFAFLVLALDLLISPSWFHAVANTALVVYPFVAMRAVYRQSVGMTLLKFLLLAFGYLLLLALSFAGTALAAFLLL